MTTIPAMYIMISCRDIDLTVSLVNVPAADNDVHGRDGGHDNNIMIGVDKDDVSSVTVIKIIIIIAQLLIEEDELDLLLQLRQQIEPLRGVVRQVMLTNNGHLVHRRSLTYDTF
jgi:hypothetical protein